MLKIWGRNTSSNVQKAMWAVGELGLAYERIDVGGAFGKNKEPAYLAMNPNGLVPTLQDGDYLLWESNSIVRYLARIHGKGSLEPSESEGLRSRQSVDGLAIVGRRTRDLCLFLGADPHARREARHGRDHGVPAENHRSDGDAGRAACPHRLCRRRCLLDGRHSGRRDGLSLPPALSRTARTCRISNAGMRACSNARRSRSMSRRSRCSDACLSATLRRCRVPPVAVRPID